MNSKIGIQIFLLYFNNQPPEFHLTPKTVNFPKTHKVRCLPENQDGPINQQTQVQSYKVVTSRKVFQSSSLVYLAKWAVLESGTSDALYDVPLLVSDILFGCQNCVLKLWRDFFIKILGWVVYFVLFYVLFCAGC